MPGDPTDYESPRQRRERIFVRKRSRRRYVLVVAAIVLFVFAGAVWALFRPKSGPVTAAEVPLIRADDQPTRKRPSDAGGMTVPDKDSLVLNRAEPSVEQLLPPPEQPLPRPTPPAAAESPGASEPVPPPQAAAPPQPATAPPDKPEPPSAATAATPPARPPSAAAAPPGPPPPAPERKTARAEPPPTPAPAGKGYRLQLGSVRTPEAAKKEWEHLKAEQSDLLGALGFTTERANLGARGIYYRIQAGPIADAATAERDCTELKRRGVGCILVKP